MMKRRNFLMLNYETLETRQLLASISFNDGNLLVSGTAGDDLIQLQGGADFQNFTIQINNDPSLTETFQYSEVNQVTVYAHQGNDRVNNTLLAKTRIYGGTGDDHIQGGYLDDLLAGGEGLDTLIGRHGNDELYGHDGVDWLYGGAGQDLLYGFDGDDHLIGGDGDDVLAGHTGNDRLIGGDGIDRLDGNSGDDLLYGNDGDDIINGGIGDDVLAGADGDDVLNGNGGEDTIYGGDGFDQLFGGNNNDRLVGQDGDDSINGGSGDDLLLGNSGDDTLNGDSGDDQLFGGVGHDILAGQTGHDRLIGGTGDDWLDGSDGDDFLNGDDGEDVIYAGQGDDIVSGGNDDDVIAGGDGDDVLNGNGGDDEIYGGGGSDQLSGGNGDDHLAGQDDDDTVNGGAGIDLLLGNAGDDEINGNDGGDTIHAGSGNDTVNGGADDDLIYGFDGLNNLYGNGGNDEIHGGQSSDYIDGGSDGDFLYGNDGRDQLFGGEGTDEIYGGPQDDFLYGGQGNDFLYGQAGDDELHGDQGSDQILGNEGDDKIYASYGDDQINGNSGLDLVHYFSNQDDFRVVSVGANYQLSDLRAADPSRTYGVDLLTDVEDLSFGELSNSVTFPIEATLSQPVDVSSINQVLSDGWKSTFRIVGDDIWVRTVKPDGTPEFDFRLGAAGVIAEIRDVDSGENLLAPSFQGESTDRVVQWTLWEIGQTIRHNVASLPDFEDRFNTTQAGTFDNVLHGTVEVEINGDQINIWSVADRNWKSEQDPFMNGTVTSMTQMTILDGGGLLVRRVIRVGEIRLRGNVVSLDNPYFEAWTPLSDAAFNAMAVSINDNGDPDEFFRDGRDIPTYQPRVSVANTRGWALGYDRFDEDGGNNLAVVFGTDIGTVFHADGSLTSNHQYSRNGLDFRGGWAILPGLLPGSLGEGAIIEQHLILLPGDTIDSSTGSQLDALAEVLPAPRVFHAGAELSSDLGAIATRLSTLSGENQTSTDHLAGLL